MLGDLAKTVLLLGNLGVARGYFQQHLEQTLAITEWDNPAKAFPSMFFLHELLKEAELKMVQGQEGATMEIKMNISAPQDAGRPSSNPALAMAAG